MHRTIKTTGLNCPNCAGKIEQAINQLAWIQTASVNIATQEITLQTSETPTQDHLKEIQQIVLSYEPDVTVYIEPQSQDSLESLEPQQKNKLIQIISASLLLAIGVFLLYKAPGFSRLTFILLLMAYLIAGLDVITAALKNITRGVWFDEHFLMAVATLGAFAIGEYVEAVAVMVFYKVGEYFQDAAVDQSRASITALMDIQPTIARVERSSGTIEISPENVQIGEILQVRPGEKIPLDGEVIEGESQVDTSALTGESRLTRLTPGDTALSGCINQTGLLRIRVTELYQDSTVRKIIELVEHAANRKAPTERLMTKFSKYYTPIVVFVALFLAVIPPLFLQQDWSEWLRRACTFLVISCPCALVISIPLTFYGGIGAASKQGVLVKGGNYLEALSQVRTVVFDKTGTLTAGQFQVRHLIPVEGISEEQLLELAAIAEQHSNHPIAESIRQAYHQEVASVSLDQIEEVAGKGLRVQYQGHSLLVGNATLLEEAGVSFNPCNDSGTKVYVAYQGQSLGVIVIDDALKPDSITAIDQLRTLGIDQCIMLTGDNEQTAQSTAKTLELDRYYAQLLPEDKVLLMEQISKDLPIDHKVAFVGDGINDAPVLARADLGVAMGALGSDAAIEAADIVLMTDEPSKLAQAIQISQKSKRIAYQNILFALGVKLLFLILGALGLTSMWLAVFADVGVALIAVFNARRMIR
ncbi:heavy metal translocating P-type ATPase [Falseniella ignava]|uniref:Cd(2+)-exporting ATPase n=1 Tax=Falseniella ignava TaxID=137730 RepID=A0A2I1JX17_9LACT|nr:heavy metal translocating P-type ATPase [Falseniella ignava]PKY87907.1 heavy metal translocating P-type ATPase [Falseniella ignava]